MVYFHKFNDNNDLIMIIIPLGEFILGKNIKDI